MKDEGLLASYRRALDRLREALSQPGDDIVRDAAIKRFEFTYELAWKALQHALAALGLVCRSPKGCLRQAFAQGMIADNELWLQMIDDRNQTVHTYNEQTAARIHAHLPSYVPLFTELLDAIERAWTTSP